MADPSSWQALAAEIYKYYLSPVIYAPWTSQLIQLVKLQAGERVLDIGSGTGTMARAAARQVGAGGRVVALNNNPVVLEIARSLSAEGATIEWIEGTVHQLPFADAQFDAIFCLSGLPFFADRPAAMREMYRVLTPGGRLGMLVWGPIEQVPGPAALAKALRRRVSLAAEAKVRIQFSLGNTEDVRRLVALADFKEIEITTRTIWTHFTSVADYVQLHLTGPVLLPLTYQVNEETLAIIIGDVSQDLQAYIHADELSYPLEAHLILAHT